MFSFLKPKLAPQGPVEFDVAVDVEKPAADVYPLLDWDDERNAKRELGNHVQAIDGQSDRFRLVMAGMPDLRFDMQMIDVVPGERYAFSTEIVPRVGRLELSEEHYSLEPAGEERCTLKLRVVATFRGELTIKQYERELMMMTVSCQRALIKLKLHAERGVEAVRALEAQIG